MIPRPWRKTGESIKCKLCGNERYYSKSRLADNRGKYCSKLCADKDYKGVHRSPNSEIKVGQRISKKTEFKKGLNEGSKNINWKGDEVKYGALHSWVGRNLKKRICLDCGSKINLEYSNISFKYKRDIKDWKVLCSKCHDAYDRKNGWGIATKMFNLK